MRKGDCRLMSIVPTPTSQQGSAIVEVLIATAVVGLVVTAIAVALTFSAHNTAQVRYREAATAFGQDLIEVMRKERKFIGWPALYGEFAEGTTHFCVPATDVLTVAQAKAISVAAECDQATPAHATTLAGIDVFRTLTVHRDSGGPSLTDDKIDIEVKVAWKNGNRDQSVTFNHQLRPWNTK